MAHFDTFSCVISEQSGAQRAGDLPPEAVAPDIPPLDARQDEIALGAQIWFERTLRDLAAATHPMIKQVSRETVADVPPPDALGASGPDEIPLYRPMEIVVDWTVDVNEVAHFDVDGFLARVYAAGESHGGQLARQILQHISDICDATGQTISATDRPFFDVLYEALSNMEMSFDEHGEPTFSIVTSPQGAERIARNPFTQEQERLIADLIQERRESWRVARRRRGLP